MGENIQNPAIGSTQWPERRTQTDRRKKPFSLIFAPFASGRRRMLRRRADRCRIYLLDFYSPRIFYAVTTVLLLTVIDAALTLSLVDGGACELNPVMGFFLKIGPLAFITAKYAITAVSVIIIVVLHYICILQVRFPLGRLLEYFVVCFATVVAWELFLILRYVH
jgi:Domain of unknown function (DUF5658)